MNIVTLIVLVNMSIPSYQKLPKNLEYLQALESVFFFSFDKDIQYFGYTS